MLKKEEKKGDIKRIEDIKKDLRIMVDVIEEEIKKNKGVFDLPIPCKDAFF